MQFLGKSSARSSEAEWLPVSDMMAGLMIIFLFIAIAHMRYEQIQRDHIKEIAVAFQQTQTDLYLELSKEFKDDLEKWDAEIDQSSLAVRFRSPEVLFSSGQAKVRDQFKTILTDFFPRYLSILSNFKNEIAEIRIEGHTSSHWSGSNSKMEAYLNNMKLSQDRTRSVLKYCLLLNSVEKDLDWARNLITANGLSSSKLRLLNGRENTKASRRVEFRVRTKAETKIMKIIEKVQ